MSNSVGTLGYSAEIASEVCSIAIKDIRRTSGSNFNSRKFERAFVVKCIKVKSRNHPQESGNVS